MRPKIKPVITNMIGIPMSAKKANKVPKFIPVVNRSENKPPNEYKKPEMSPSGMNSRLWNFANERRSIAFTFAITNPVRYRFVI